MPEAVKIEVEPPHLYLVFESRCDSFVAPWQDVWNLIAVLNQAVTDIKDDTPPDSLQLNRECGQLTLRAVTDGQYKGCVILFFDWTDRLRFTWRSACVLRDALKLCADDARLAMRGIHFKYDAQGMVRELHDLKQGTVQLIPGR